jgi:SP family myo-inositol transporter-like MFS transporter 13
MAGIVDSSSGVAETSKAGYNRFLLLVAGVGGLLYGVDVGIIAGALPYLEATSGLNAGQLSIVVAAVLLGSVISTLFAGALADWTSGTALVPYFERLSPDLLVRQSCEDPTR